MSADVVIIDSGGANLASLQFALGRLGARAVVSAEPATIAAAPRVLLPGVGSAGDAMHRLRAAGVDRVLPGLRQPLLGICLGMQLLFERSAEGDTAGLGILPGSVDRLVAAPGRPVPHMGWNTVEASCADPLLEGIQSGEHFYFVHSYAARPGAGTLATADYGGPVVAVAGRDNFRGVQFHPERSGVAGARLLANFLRLP
ncbi:MAG: imidazole glycerol phosphate synthase subunit HisH [Steroidobacteraceae bacterium]|jgi:glutamine amidotransferase|nr:imidazole glycerol phosphate synthase subunit HisH [Steroidobacteraceae bacterium]